MQTDLWQWAKADGTPAWTPGTSTFAHVWDRAYELLRFERGAGFYITDRKAGTRGPALRLDDVADRLRKRMLDEPGRVFEVRSVKTNFALVFRRTIEQTLLGGKFLDVGREYIGAPYVLGGTTSHGLDCSGLVIVESNPFDITYSQHKAAVMWAEFKAGKDGKVIIPRDKVLRGDLLVIRDGDHIATYIDDRDGGRVLDAEPHSVQSPWGYTPSGVQVRSMAPNYYCSWANVNAVCRLVKINGEP